MPSQFEEQSFRNLINFLKDDLLLIEKGYPIKDIFPNDLFRTNLGKKGILKMVFSNKGPHNKHGRKIVLSDRAREVLNGLRYSPPVTGSET